MNEAEALMLVAEVAVAVAGFSGIATAIDRRQGTEVWSEARRVRFSYMLTHSGIALFASLITLVFLYRAGGETGDTGRVWLGASLYWAVFACVGTGFGYWRGRSLPTLPGIEAFIAPSVIVVFSLLIALQLYNVVFVREFWPYLAGLVGNLAFAFVQFMRIVLLRAEPSNQAADAPSERATP